MSGLLVNLVDQVIAGVIGGNGIGAAFKDASLGPAVNSIAGAIGGGLGGQLLQSLVPAIAGAAGRSNPPPLQGGQWTSQPRRDFPVDRDFAA
jgi:hypothetical protein